jgi:hypothetical protein
MRLPAASRGKIHPLDQPAELDLIYMLSYIASGGGLIVVLVGIALLIINRVLAPPKLRD